MEYCYGTQHFGDVTQERPRATGVSYLDTARDHGIDFEVAPQVGLRQGIDATKMFLPRLQFDKSFASRGWDCLSNYRREYNDKLRVFMDRPLHDWASHGADAMRMAAVTFGEGFNALASMESFDIISSRGKSRKIITPNNRDFYE